MKSLICAICLVILLTAAARSTAQDSAQTKEQTAWTVLNTGLEDNSTDVRVRAVHVLGELNGNAKAKDAAISALKNDQQAEVRASAAQSLGEMGAKDAVADLHATFQDTDPSVIIAAAHSLIELGDNTGYNVYYAVLTGEQKTGQSLTEQQKKMLKDPKKMAALGVQVGVGFIPFGGLAMGGYKMLTRDDTSPVLAAAALMLAKDPDPKSGNALVDASANKDKWLVRAAAFDAIAKRGDPALLVPAEDGLQDDKDLVRISAAAAVIRLHDIQSQPKPEAKKPAPKKPKK
ncbi:MAG TPA: HEAT repeat domain-containing protein [Alloacidobacterium sp.]|nr:HEAT repeat domain-containing protein [Alloacidobacterium sp.]